MNLPSSKIEEMTQADLDALISAYNSLREMLANASQVAEKIFMSGIGVEMSDPRFHARIAAHTILSAMTIRDNK